MDKNVKMEGNGCRMEMKNLFIDIHCSRGDLQHNDIHYVKKA